MTNDVDAHRCQACLAQVSREWIRCETCGSTPLFFAATCSIDDVLSRPIGQIDLSVRAVNFLTSVQIATVGDLVQWTEGDLRAINWRGELIGRRIVRGILETLAQLDLSLRAPIEVLLTQDQRRWLDARSSSLGSSAGRVIEQLIDQAMARAPRTDRSDAAHTVTHAYPVNTQT